jgi:DNA-binding NarL/FixJ family response regulator
MMQCRVLLGDAHEVVLEGLRRILDRPQFEVVGAVKDGLALVKAAQELRPNLIVSEIGMPLLNGVEAVRQIRKRDPKSKVVFLTMHPEAVHAVEAIHAGGSGYVLKSSPAEELVAAIQEVLEGRIYLTPALAEPVMRALQARRKNSSGATGHLTPRQREVLQMVAEGKTVKEAAAALRVSVRTVEFHKYRIMETLGLRSAAGLAGYAIKQGILVTTSPLGPSPSGKRSELSASIEIELATRTQGPG